MQPILDDSCRFDKTDISRKTFSSSRQEESDIVMTFLSKLEVSEIDAVVSRYKLPKYRRSCGPNVLEIINSLPKETTDKLKVVIATHEENGLMTFFNQNYSYHVFIMGKAENGIVIFDPQIPNSNSMNLALWTKSVFNKVSIHFACTNSFTLQHLPQFWILDGSIYIDQYKDALRFETLHPEYAMRKKKSTLDYPLWQQSLRVNLYEICQLSTGNTSYEDMAKNHKDCQSPLTRLKDEHIAFLRQFYEST